MKNTMLAMIGLASLGSALTLGACVGEETPSEPVVQPDDAEDATASFALTDQCAACATQAASNVCGPQALACLNDPNCNNVSACVQACAPSDALCIAGCYQQASQLLDDLADCVVCQECTVECDGLWTCGGGGGGGAGGMNAGGMNAGGGGMNAGGGGGMGGSAPSGLCDNSGNCQACVACAANGPCSAQVQACLMDPTCMLDPNVHQAAIECTVCLECANDCQDFAAVCGP